jgi:hypothetical protein
MGCATKPRTTDSANYLAFQQVRPLLRFYERSTGEGAIQEGAGSAPDPKLYLGPLFLGA